MSKRSFRRPAGKRRYRRLFVIAAEGKRTEPEYFRMFNSLFTSEDERVVLVKCLKGHGNSPKHVLSKMKEFLRHQNLMGSDEAWLVVDKDQWNPSDLDKLFQWSQSSNNYGVAVSNPCFEHWLVLHFEDCRCMSADECIRRLRRHLPDYDKTIEPNRLVPGIQDAIQRAKQIDKPPCVDWPRSAGCTTVYKLVEKAYSMLKTRPAQDEILALLGRTAFDVWKAVCDFISDHYNMDVIWDDGGKYGAYEQKFRRSGKTLCTLYIKEGELVVLTIFGKAEREKFEAERMHFSPQMQAIYDNAKTYHDGKWMYAKLKDSHMFSDITRMLFIKKKPNRRLTLCGYLCDICKAFAPNIKKKDERERLSALWRKYYDLDIPAERIYCEGCRSMRKDARRIDNNCPVRACVLRNRIDNCGQCSKYRCDIFMEIKGLSYEEARKEQGQLFDEEEYEEYMLAYDNGSRLDRQRN